MSPSIISRSAVSPLISDVCSGVTNNKGRKTAPRRRALRPWTEATPCFPGARWGAPMWRGALWLGVVLLGCGSVSLLHAQTVKILEHLRHPFGLAVDGSGNVYVTSDDAATGVLELSGCASGNCATTALGGGFFYPYAVAVDESGNVYVADVYHNAVKEMPPGCTSANYANKVCTTTTLGGGFDQPFGVAVDKKGNVYVADTGNNAVKELPPGCASSACVTELGGGFSQPYDVAVRGNGHVYVTDQGNNAVKEVPPGCRSAACVTTLGGSFADPVGVAVDGRGGLYVTGEDDVRVLPPGCDRQSCVTELACCFAGSDGVAVDRSGNVYVVSTYSGLVQEIMPCGVNPADPAGKTMPPVNFGSVEVGDTGPEVALWFTFRDDESDVSASVLTQGAPGLDFADAGSGSCATIGNRHRYRAGDKCKIDVKFAPQYAGARNGSVVLSGARGVIATAYIQGTGMGPQLAFGPATPIVLGEGGFTNPESVAVDGSGNVYVGGFGDSVVTEIPRGCDSPSCVKTLGGGFEDASGLAVDGSGNVYVADVFVGVKEMPPGCASQSCETALGAGFGVPVGVAVDGSGNVYVADDGDSSVKEMPPGCLSSTCVTTLGGGFGGPNGVAVDGSGNVYVADVSDSAVKVIPPGCTSASCVGTLGGGFYQPFGVAVDGSGNVYVADTYNSAMKVVPAGCASSACVTTLSPVGSVHYPYGLAVDGSGNIYAADYFVNTVVELDVASVPSFAFANSSVGVESSDSPMTALLRNIGNAPLIFPVPQTGENPNVPANFTLDASSTCPEIGPSSSAGTLSAGAGCTLAVDFIPTTTGTITGAVVLTDNNLNGRGAAQRIGLSGIGEPTP